MAKNNCGNYKVNKKTETNNKTKTSQIRWYGLTAIMVIAIVGIIAFNTRSTFGNKESINETISSTTALDEALEIGEQSNSNQQQVKLTDEGDLIIPISDITEEASFYSVEIDGTQLEVLAVEAPDGTIRTAFNTCQICYGSGRGYYIQQGNALICQNCGNQFMISEVEVVRGGCNPVPIFPEDKTINDDSIIISRQFLEESKEIFADWKVVY